MKRVLDRLLSAHCAALCSNRLAQLLVLALVCIAGIGTIYRACTMIPGRSSTRARVPLVYPSNSSLHGLNVCNPQDLRMLTAATRLHTGLPYVLSMGLGMEDVQAGFSRQVKSFTSMLERCLAVPLVRAWRPPGGTCVQPLPQWVVDRAELVYVQEIHQLVGFGVHVDPAKTVFAPFLLNHVGSVDVFNKSVLNTPDGYRHTRHALISCESAAQKAGCDRATGPGSYAYSRGIRLHCVQSPALSKLPEVTATMSPVRPILVAMGSVKSGIAEAAEAALRTLAFAGVVEAHLFIIDTVSWASGSHMATSLAKAQATAPFVITVSRPNVTLPSDMNFSAPTFQAAYRDTWVDYEEAAGLAASMREFVQSKVVTARTMHLEQAANANDLHTFTHDPLPIVYHKVVGGAVTRGGDGVAALLATGQNHLLLFNTGHGMPASYNRTRFIAAARRAPWAMSVASSETLGYFVLELALSNVPIFLLPPTHLPEEWFTPRIGERIAGGATRDDIAVRMHEFLAKVQKDQFTPRSSLQQSMGWSVSMARLAVKPQLAAVAASVLSPELGCHV